MDIKVHQVIYDINQALSATSFNRIQAIAFSESHMRSYHWHDEVCSLPQGKNEDIEQKCRRRLGKMISFDRICSAVILSLLLNLCCLNNWTMACNTSSNND